MKKGIRLGILISLFSLSLVGGASATISWFSNRANVSLRDNINGESNGAYFKGGTGEKDDPFIISEPIHLYNLAWLQYLGYFNTNTLGAEEGSTYFEIDEELTGPINMSGWVVPPIGTTLYPFVGNFNGNGKTITNLKTINDSSPATYIKYPSPVRSAGVVNNVNVIGAFGVFGTCNINNSAVYPVDKPATAAIPPYTSTNAIYDVYFDNSEVVNYQSSTLAGIAAGYVNAPMTNVGVSSSSSDTPSRINLSNINASPYGGKTSNLSDFTIAGFCEEQYKEELTRTTSDVYSATTVNQDTAGFTQQAVGQSVGFGGSIDMNEMYDGLRAVWDQYSTYSSNQEDGGSAYDQTHLTNGRDGRGVYAYPSTRTIIYNEDGTLQSDTYGNTYTNFVPSSGFSYYTNYQTNASGQKTSQYTFTYNTGTRFMYLYGHNTISVANFTGTNNGTAVTTTNYNTINATVFKISCTVNGTPYYLTRTGTNTLGYTNNTDNATQWIYRNNYIYYNNTSGNNSSYEYLYYNGGNLGLTNTENNRSSFSYDNTRQAYYTAQGGTNYYLTYNAGWKFMGLTTTYNYLIYSGTNYLTANGTNAVTNSTNRANATRWKFNNKQAYITVNGTDYYLRVSTNNGGTVDLNTTARGSYIPDLPTTNGGTTSGNYRYNTNRYLRYNRGWTTSNTNTNVTVECEVVAGITNHCSYETVASSYKEKATTNTTEYYTFETNHTYFPLRQNTNAQGIPDGTPLNSQVYGSNTGYVIGGGNATSNSWAGSIRVSQYYGADYVAASGTYRYYDSSLMGLTTSGSNVKLGTIYTIENDNMSSSVINNISKYERLEKAKGSLESVITDDKTWIYGLHFVNTPIGYGPGVSAYAESAFVNGESYTNYELPTNCIDFNLKEKGYINFIAGAYYSGNNCFFTINEVQRNSSTQAIDNIRNIAAVYSDGVASHSVIYEYTDYNNNGTNKRYSIPYKLENGNKVQLDGSEYTPYSSTSNAPSTYNSYSTGGYQRVFNCRWIDSSASLQTGTGYPRRNSHTGTADSSNSYVTGYPYYFETLMNDGEYCMGSPSFNGASGAYLMYLDIGANAQLTYRSTVTDYLHEVTESFVLPLGMAIISAGTTNVNNKNSYITTVKNNYQGVVSIQRSVDDGVETGVYASSTASENVVLSYAKNDVVVNGGESPVAISKEDITIYRTIYYDFLPNSQSFNKTIVDKTITTSYSYGVASPTVTTYTVEQYSGYTNASNIGTHVAASNVGLFDNEGYTVTTTAIAQDDYRRSISASDYENLIDGTNIYCFGSENACVQQCNYKFKSENVLSETISSIRTSFL